MNYFVTGTDTGVGKTLVSCALLHGFAAQGKRVVGMKPVAAGCDDDGQNEDVLQLRAAGNVAVGYGQINPYCFVPAIAPHLAAQRAGVIIRISRIATSYRELAAQADVVIVEGAGGLLVPLNEQQDSADLAKELGLPVILVAGMRLGCLNHALLTQESIAARGLVLAGWVANVLDAEMPALQQNIDTLQQRIAAPLLGIVPHLPRPDARDAAGRLDLDRLYNNGVHPD
ncbi:MAG TPA: dethiobiotin synthase [Gallionella sp.]|nr:dethiobiotin synthase [Gallionella sp.]